MFSPSSAAFDGASPEGDSRRAVVVANEEEEGAGELTIDPRAMIAALEGEGATNASTTGTCLPATKASTSVARMAFAFWVNVMVKYQLCVSFWKIRKSCFCFVLGGWNCGDAGERDNHVNLRLNK